MFFLIFRILTLASNKLYTGTQKYLRIFCAFVAEMTCGAQVLGGSQPKDAVLGRLSSELHSIAPRLRYVCILLGHQPQVS